MNSEQLERAIRLWKQAFAIRRWLPGPLAACEEVAAVEAWLEHQGGLLSAELRPAREDVVALARMLTSFAATSFNTRAYRLRVPKGAQRAKAKARSSAAVLKAYALEALACEHGLVPAAEAQRRLDLGLHPPELTLMTYARELIRRTEYASQGLSVYWLWLELDEHSRKGLTVAAVQQAEQRLLEWLKQPDSIAAEAR
ncbi:MAG: hypothetical protein J0L84_12575 [Verrucomicrobia bacterium]|nr:hypothetical protein [Verrucomicrobiota bacterium]